MPEEARLLAVFHLGVGQRRDAMRTPVDDAVAAIDQSLFIEVDKHFADGAGAALVKGEALTRPIAGSPQFFELPRDARLVFILPLPNAFEEFLASEVVARQALFLAQTLLDLDLRGDAGVIRSGDPKGIVPLHTLVANQNVLQGFVKRVTHVELPRDVRWRNDHRKMRRVVLRVGRKVAFLAPIGVDAVLELRGVIGFRQFFVLIHNSFLFFHCR